MTSIASLNRQRKTLLHLYRHPPNRRSAIVPTFACCWPTATPSRPIAAVLYTSTTTIARWQQRFHDGGLLALAGHKLGRWPLFWSYRAGVTVRWVTRHTPATAVPTTPEFEWPEEGHDGVVVMGDPDTNF